MLLLEGGGFYSALFHFSTSFGIIQCFCLKEGVFTQPYFMSAFGKEKNVSTSSSCIITLWLKGYWTRPTRLNHIIYYLFFYTLFIFGSLLYWLYLGFSMASSRDSCRESYLSFLNSYRSPAQGFAMLKSRHIPASEIRRFGSNFYPQKRRPLLLLLNILTFTGVQELKLG